VASEIITLEDYNPAMIHADPANKPETIALYRSPMARLTGKKEAGLYLINMMEREKPYVSKVIVDEDNQVEHWRIEKQFWLKFKRQFQDFGYLPTQKLNTVKGTPHMLEEY